MNSMINLMSMIGVHKTLIIACGHRGLNNFLEYNERIFIYYLPNRILQKHDPRELARIQHFIEDKGCTQIIFVGTLDESLLSRVRYADTFIHLRNGLQFNLKKWMGNRERVILTSTQYNQLAVERHVLTQCMLLMEYFFIRDLVEKDQLHVHGFVGELDEEFVKPIFYNGIVYNDTVSMN